ncbi:MAG TPA: hypothetical protein VFI78_01595 [Salinimicrobium sp.]|nr:hypothetical protein [Salinimicrobium sp.]
MKAPNPSTNFVGDTAKGELLLGWNMKNGYSDGSGKTCKVSPKATL